MAKLKGYFNIWYWWDKDGKHKPNVSLKMFKLR